MSRFTDALDLQLVEVTPDHPMLSDSGRSMWRVLQPLVWEVGAIGSGVTITVPAGTLTDLASIPRPLWAALPPDGPWTKAAVLHDALYKSHGDLQRLGHQLAFTRAEADKILDDAMAAVGVGRLARWAIYAGVRVGGAGSWGS